MRHQDLTINHILESWVYANAAARIAASGFVSGDIGRVAYQQDTGQYWRLTATTPTWQLLTGVAMPTLQSSQGTPAATTSTTDVMMGMAYAITPVRSGKVLFVISGSMRNTVANSFCRATLRYGTGSAPANGAAATGTAAGGSAVGTSTDPNFSLPFTVVAIATGFTINTALWFDLAVSSASGGSAQLINIAGTAFELP
jgi:hypothetical protein